MGWRMFTITCSSMFLLGSTFVHWTADHNTLWRSPVTPEALQISLDYYSILAASSPLLPQIWIGFLFIALVAVGWRIFAGMKNETGEGDGGSFVFDGGSLVLLLAVAFTQLHDVFPVIVRMSAIAQATNLGLSPSLNEPLAEVARDLAGSNAVICVALTGVMLLQAGRKYAEISEGKARLAEKESARARAENDQSTRSAESSTSTSREASPRRRAATPHRELTEEEALELKMAAEEEENGKAVAVGGGQAWGGGQSGDVPFAGNSALNMNGLRLERKFKRAT